MANFKSFSAIPMLEQRTAEKKGYITLREAAEISGYAPDYIGQLIRAGKIEGEQVYSSVAWVTTEDSVKTYMTAKNKAQHQLVASESYSDVVKGFGVYLLYILSGTLGLTLLVIFYIFSVSLDKAIEQRSLDTTTAEFEVVTSPEASNTVAYD